ncbi:MAG: hypothetical protein QM708_00045 [Propioniciclava sp.]|uniref:hypothetical protein n=1 Tax=Propioniciclava sp. TaxID=2038686 RepID=UPI0039E637C3
MHNDSAVLALGRSVRLDLSGLSEADAATVRRVWRGAEAAPGDPLPTPTLTVPVAADRPLDQMLTLLSQAVTLAAIEACRGELWMLHAAGIADERGRVLALVGPSGRGKTTAVRALATHFGYLTDETVGVAADGSVVPYRKPLSVIEKAGWVKAQRPPDELGLRRLPEAPLQLSGLILLDRRTDGPEIPIVEDCDLGDALPDLIAQTSYVGELPAPLRTIASHVAATGGVRRIIYREAESLAETVGTLFRDPESPGLGDPLTLAQAASGRSACYRAAYLDALPLNDPDRVALLQSEPSGTVIFRLLSGIAPALWRAADGAPVDRLVAAAVDAYGEPDGGQALTIVKAAIDELLADGVLADEPSWRIREGDEHTSDDRVTSLGLEGPARRVWDVLSGSRGITSRRLIGAVAEDIEFDTDAVADAIGVVLHTLQTEGILERVAP